LEEFIQFIISELLLQRCSIVCCRPDGRVYC